ncbi:hypothetical protein Cme02nite_52230 [Catellatospora methionotrophica]|uniref:PIN domain-containing protein n=1 Tax=Catellatospora methionotrophica TaxID=121620 RepID=A0A8J3PGL0_9ACTN|nr:hypothetical protein [Catellatospora methionotrophica]GIG16891.1 hypothetical protein Cme02nite_52230 [Catellatospora methionotrophica]
MRRAGRVLDTGAIRRYVAADSLTVSAALAGLEAGGFTALVPALCLSEAYWAADRADEPMLDVLRTLPQVEVVALSAGDAQAVGGLAHHLGTLGLAHACLLAAVLRVPLMTTEPTLAGKILGADLLREV